MNTRSIKIILALGLLALTGCTSAQFAKLPIVNADTLMWVRSDPLGGGSISAKNVKKQPDGSLTADEVTWDEKYPQWSVHLAVTGYKQDAPVTK